MWIVDFSEEIVVGFDLTSEIRPGLKELVIGGFRSMFWFYWGFEVRTKLVWVDAKLFFLGSDWWIRSRFRFTELGEYDGVWGGKISMFEQLGELGGWVLGNFDCSSRWLRGLGSLLALSFDHVFVSCFPLWVIGCLGSDLGQFEPCIGTKQTLGTWLIIWRLVNLLA